MSPLHSKKGLAALKAAAERGDLFAFDYDGTLVKIVPTPGGAKFEKPVEEALKALARVVPVAIVSGRGLPDLQERFSSGPAYLIGNHGFEGVGRGGFRIVADRVATRRACAHWRAQLALALGTQIQRLGIEIEDKEFSISLHYRRSSDPRGARALLMRVVKSLKPTPRVVLGKFVINVVHREALHKGTALLELMRQAGAPHAVYFGDDVTDEDVFDMEHPRVLSIRVGARARSRAPFYIRSQKDILKVLHDVLKWTRPRKRDKIKKSI